MDEEEWQKWIEEVSASLYEGRGNGIPIKLRAVLPQLIVARIKELGYHKEKPRLLSDKELWDVMLEALKHTDPTHREEVEDSRILSRAIAQAQWDICVKHYEGGE